MEKLSFSAKLVAFLSGLSGLTAYGAILGILLACGLGLPIPEDITLLAAGVLAAIGKISFTGAIIAGMVGVLIGDSFLFFLGRKLGNRVFTLPVFRTIFNERRINLARKKVLNNSKFICFSARFLPGLRAPIYLTAGIMGVRPLLFFALDGFAALISVPVWIYVGWFFGNNLDQAFDIAAKLQGYLLAGIAVIILSYFLWSKRKRKKEEHILNETTSSVVIKVAKKDSVTPGNT